MKRGFLKLIGATIMTATLAPSAHAAEFVTSDLYLPCGQLESVPLHHTEYVEKLFVRAVGADSRDGMFEVWANGKLKGTIYVPGRDPKYVVTIRERISSIEFRHISGGPASIINVYADNQRSGSSYARPQLGGSGAISATEIAQNTIQIVNDIKLSANYGQLGLYLLPIRRSAAELYSVAASHSAYDLRVRSAMQDLLAKISQAEAYIESNLETDQQFDGATDLLTMKEQLENALR